MTRRYSERHMPSYIRIINETDLTSEMRVELIQLQRDSCDGSEEDNDYASTRADQDTDNNPER